MRGLQRSELLTALHLLDFGTLGESGDMTLMNVSDSGGATVTREECVEHGNEVVVLRSDVSGRLL
jgi:hypothetical protein